MNYDTLDADVVKILPVHYTPGRGGRNIEFIGIHYNAGNLTVEGCYNVWLNREASAHYQIESSGRTGQLVWDGDTAWALGDFTANQKAINIEHANKSDGTITEECLDAGAHLVAALCKHFGLGRPQWDVNVFPHKHFKATACPGQIYGSQKDAYIQRAQYWYDQMVNPQPAPKPTTPLPDILKKYTDLDPDAWYISSIEEAVKKGYMHGYSETIFAPSDNLTRAQATVVIANAAGVTFESPYADVNANPYYYDPVVWAKEEGIVSSDISNFRPNDVCTREEFCTMLCNWKGEELNEEPAGYTDWGTISDFAQGSVAWCVKNGVLSGNNGTIRPHDPCTRAETAAMLVNLMKEE